MGDTISIVTHDNPIGLGPNNYMIHASIDRVASLEQLWTRQLAPDRFEIACLPFFTYGICYRDIVAIDDRHLMKAVIEKSGHRTLRVALVRDDPHRDHFHERLHALVVELDMAHEWLQGSYLAIDLPPEFDADLVVEHLKGPREVGALFWEIDS